MSSNYYFYCDTCRTLYYIGEREYERRAYSRQLMRQHAGHDCFDTDDNRFAEPWGYDDEYHIARPNSKKWIQRPASEVIALSCYKDHWPGQPQPAEIEEERKRYYGEEWGVPSNDQHPHSRPRP